MGTISNLKYRFATAGMLMKIIYINIAVFLLLRIAGIICYFAGIDLMTVLSFVELPSSLSMLAKTPWTIITYMFAHYDVMHILFNMLVLYWFGKLFLDFFTPKQFCALYIIGGIGGALLYLLAYGTLPTLVHSLGWLIGASASVMAIVIAIAVKIPDFKLNLLFFGPVSLRWIAIVYVLIDFLSITGENMGGHIAHLGGALTGLLFIMLLNRGTDITQPINKIIDFFANKKDSFRNISFKKNASQKSKANNSTRTYSGANQSTQTMSKEDEQTLDIILDKIKKSGYTALSAEEKKRLFDVSKRIK